jgi:hypothetical protein
MTQRFYGKVRNYSAGQVNVSFYVNHKCNFPTTEDRYYYLSYANLMQIDLKGF